MESAVSIYALSSALSAAAGSPTSSMLVDFLTSCWTKHKLRKRVSGLLMLKGVSTLCSKLTTADVLFLDIDKLFQTLILPPSAEEENKENTTNPIDVLLTYPVIRAHIVNIASIYRSRIILVS